ncbi:YcaO-like family protein [Nocardiopsis sp. NPDC049922]|uniref:YcaO-like family protein n=1 Tax=Nocardiopsis sp. NPDC049922 TaxID=3155157 RepID=UPI0033CBF651
MNQTPLSGLVDPLGVVSEVRSMLTGRGLERLHLSVALGGDLHNHNHGRSANEGLNGTGRVFDDERHARTVAVAEAAERYAGAHPAAETTTATAARLEGPVMDTDRIPRCSEAEYARPDCPFTPFDPDAEIRWVRGTDLITGEPTWLPAVMACYGLHPLPQERFAYRISTGHAVHTDPARAVLGGLMEVVERDAIALTWLQRLPLRPAAPEVLGERARHLLDHGRRRFLETHVFDATTDTGIPTAYVLQRSPYDASAANLVGAGTGTDLAEAVEGALGEAFTFRHLYHDDEDAKSDFGSFTGVMDGARYMAHPDRAHAFSFLTDGLADRTPSTGPTPLPREPRAALARALERLDALGAQVLCVDRTTKELRAAGLTAVAVVIPELQPMSLQPLGQFRGHPRLMQAPPRMGFPAYPEEEQNPWPQPFA